MDPRATQLASVLLDHSLRVKQGDKVVIVVSDFTALEVVQECYRMCLELGALVHIDMMHISLYGSRCDVGDLFSTFLQHQKPAQLAVPPPMMGAVVDWGDKFILLSSVHNRNYLSHVDPKKISCWQATYSKAFEGIVKKDRVVVGFPTNGIAQNARMSLTDFTDYFYRATIIDYAALGKRIQAVQDVLDRGKRVRILSTDTDVTIGIAGRLAAGAQAGRRNVPDGECFIAPEEGETEGIVSFEYPQMKDGNDISRIRLRFERGSIVEATAERGLAHLLAALDDHPGNRRLGELGIGLNPNIQSYICDTIFDEKILGTIHLALGSAYPFERGGGVNRGTIHWDLVKDLRHTGSLLTVDDEPIIRDGKILV